MVTASTSSRGGRRAGGFLAVLQYNGTRVYLFQSTGERASDAIEVKGVRGASGRRTHLYGLFGDQLWRRLPLNPGKSPMEATCTSVFFCGVSFAVEL